MIKEWKILADAYARYKLLWMLYHDVSLLDMSEMLLYEQRSHLECEKDAYPDAALKLLSYAENDIRRSGRLYPDFSAFQSGAYQDEQMMRRLLHKDELEAWRYYREHGALSRPWSDRKQKGGSP